MGKKFEIVDGVYDGPSSYPDDLDLRGTSVTSLGCLKSVDGYLDLEGSSVTSLGSLRSVGGTLDLADTPITSLGLLKSVGSWLALEGTQITSLGSLVRVGRWLEIRDTGVYSLGSLESVRDYIRTGCGGYNLTDLKSLVKEIEDSSMSTLVERLHVEKDPFLKRVIERRIRGA